MKINLARLLKDGNLRGIAVLSFIDEETGQVQTQVASHNINAALGIGMIELASDSLKASYRDSGGTQSTMEILDPPPSAP